MELMSALLEVNGVYLSYEQVPLEECILRDVTFAISPGKVYCLMGANGCGKTTLINCILGIHKPMSGSVSSLGEDTFNMKAQELARRISFVPQIHERTFPYTVSQVVMMGRSVYSNSVTGPGREDQAYVEAALRKVGIEDLAERPYTRISGGEMQLVMLARALCQDAPLIIMDEPGAHLDFRNELVFMETVADLVKNSDKTVLISTHSPNQPFFFERSGVDTEVIAVADGEIRYTGKPSDVLTEEKIREVYGIRSRVIQDGDIRQIVPVSTKIDD